MQKSPAPRPWQVVAKSPYTEADIIISTEADHPAAGQRLRAEKNERPHYRWFIRPKPIEKPQ